MPPIPLLLLLLLRLLPFPPSLLSYLRSYCPKGVAKLREMFDAVNGIIFQGGGADLAHEDSPYLIANKLLLKWAREENAKPGVTFPVHGTCLGFQSILTASTDILDLTKPTDSLDQATWVNFTDAAWNSSFFREMPERVMKRLGNLTELSKEEKERDEFHGAMVNMNHHYGVYCDEFEKHPILREMFTLLSTNTDKQNRCYASTVEGTGDNFPITATQWHPEKAGFEWQLPAVPHGADSIKVGQATANRFVALARGNDHKPPSAAFETDMLLYNYDVDFAAGPKYGGLGKFYPYGPNTSKQVDQSTVFDRTDAWRVPVPLGPPPKHHHDRDSTGAVVGPTQNDDGGDKKPTEEEEEQREKEVAIAYTYFMMGYNASANDMASFLGSCSTLVLLYLLLCSCCGRLTLQWNTRNGNGGQEDNEAEERRQEEEERRTSMSSSSSNLEQGKSTPTAAVVTAEGTYVAIPTGEH